MGTTGTLMGAGRRLKEHDPKVRVVGVEPNLGHKIQGLKNMQESTSRRTTIRPSPTRRSAWPMTTPQHHPRARLKEGLFVGNEQRRGVWGALQMATRIESGTVVVILPDRGDRYLSTSLFTSVCAKCPP